MRSQKVRYARHVAGMGELRSAFDTVAAKPGGREYFEILNVVWKDGIKQV
jgi:hypothetical protein